MLASFMTTLEELSAELAELRREHYMEIQQLTQENIRLKKRIARMCEIGAGASSSQETHTVYFRAICPFVCARNVFII